MAKTVAKPVEKSEFVADAVEASALTGNAPSDLETTVEVISNDAEAAVFGDVAALIENSTLVPAAEIAAAKSELKGPPGVTLVIKGPAQGRWRAGRHFGPEPMSILSSDLTHDEAKALADDPELMISVIHNRPF